MKTNPSIKNDALGVMGCPAASVVVLRETITGPAALDIFLTLAGLALSEKKIRTQKEKL